MDTAVVIMAVGLCSRFGQGIKQLEAVGPGNESIMEYSVHDAIEAGFNRVIFILRRDIFDEFRREVGERLEQACQALNVKIDYVFQELADLPEGVALPAERKKPWGTGQAVLTCKDLIDCPFVVINADDYYGKEAFHLVHQFLEQPAAEGPETLCMAAFILKNTLPDNGDVTRGICKVDTGYLTAVQKTYQIEKRVDEAGTVTAWSNNNQVDTEALVSVNMWGLTTDMMKLLETGFQSFFDEIAADPNRAERELKAEYLLPIYIDQLLKANQVTVKVLESHDRWFGVTYQADKQKVKDELKVLVEPGTYAEPLFSDLTK